MNDILFKVELTFFAVLPCRHNKQMDSLILIDVINVT